MGVARTFSPNPVFGLLGWGLLPILMIFADLPDIPHLRIFSILRTMGVKMGNKRPRFLNGVKFLTV